MSSSRFSLFCCTRLLTNSTFPRYFLQNGIRKIIIKQNYALSNFSFPKNSRRQFIINPFLGITAGAMVAYGFYWKTTKKTVEAASENVDSTTTKSNFDQVPSRPDLPVYSMDQVSEHNSEEKGIWVTYDKGVYDITAFVSVHPGGLDKIRLAYGGALEPFWILYAVHKSPDVLEILEDMRIGNLDPKDIEKLTEELKHDPYMNDPKRDPTLIPCSVKPFNAETPPEILTENFTTPNQVFFVRNHLPVPDVDVNNYAIEISGLGLPSQRLTLDDLKKKYSPVTITATMQCTGNRRNEMNPVKPVKGLTWGFTAISNATWTGVRLSDVLADIGLTFDRVRRNEGVWNHVHFEGLDNDPTGQRYGASILLEKAVDEKSDVILAYEMNGQPLSRDHGFPVRMVVPGVTAARSVKWLSKIYVSNEESKSHWQRNDYKSFSPSTDWDTVDFNSAPAIQDVPVQSAICTPLNGEEIPKGSKEIEVKGYAWSGGGRAIIRVDVSADGGQTWNTATLQQEQSQRMHRMWAWSLWSCTIPITSDCVNQDGTVRLMCKATDLSYNVQPDNVAGIWNLRGVLNNAWHKINLIMEH